MQAIVSPYKTADMDRTIPQHWSKLGLLGRVIWKLRRPTEWLAYGRSLKRQLGERGVVANQVWETARRLEIAQQIEAILADCCWGEHYRFHPSDPWFVIGQWEIGDLSELDAWWKICKQFEIPYDKDYFEKNFARQIEQGLTFGELVTLVEEHRACKES